MIAKTDSDIRHVTPSGGNVFADLGFHKQDAEKFYADSLNEIENTLAIKQQLMEEITLWITQNQMKQAEVASSGFAYIPTARFGCRQQEMQQIHH